MDDFLREFHLRQREEALQERGFASLWHRFTAWFGEFGTKWAYGAGIAYATILALFVLVPREPVGEGPVLESVGHELPVEPSAAIQQLDELDLRPTSEGSVGEQEF